MKISSSVVVIATEVAAIRDVPHMEATSITTGEGGQQLILLGSDQERAAFLHQFARVANEAGDAIVASLSGAVAR